LGTCPLSFIYLSLSPSLSLSLPPL
jgi:hypothetical protein